MSTGKAKQTLWGNHRCHIGKFEMIDFVHDTEEEALSLLLNDPDFEELKISLNSPNMFEVLDVTRKEIRHSNFLAWLLNPMGSHGLNDFFLKRFLRDLTGRSAVTDLSVLEVENTSPAEFEILREWKHIDIVVKTTQYIVIIENKIDTKDHSKQLSRYKEAITREAPNVPIVCVYLTPYGESPLEDHTGFLNYSYGEIADHLQAILRIHQRAMSARQQVYIEDYLNVLSRHIMKNDHLNQLVAKLYKKHQVALDFIFDNKPDVRQDIAQSLHMLIEESGWLPGSTSTKYIRFLTPALEPRIKIYDEKFGWPNRESFLFEFVLNISTQDRLVLSFKTVISPGTHKDRQYRDGLINAVSKIDGAAKPIGGKWVCHFTIKIAMSKISEYTDEERLKKLREFWPKVDALVQKVESHLIKHLNDDRNTH